MEKTIKRPKYKIGDSVVIKKWFYYGIVEILRAYWCDVRKEWRYCMKGRGDIVTLLRGENNIIWKIN